MLYSGSQELEPQQKKKKKKRGIKGSLVKVDQDPISAPDPIRSEPAVAAQVQPLVAPHVYVSSPFLAQPLQAYSTASPHGSSFPRQATSLPTVSAPTYATLASYPPGPSYN